MIFIYLEYVIYTNATYTLTTGLDNYVHHITLILVAADPPLYTMCPKLRRGVATRGAHYRLASVAKLLAVSITTATVASFTVVATATAEISTAVTATTANMTTATAAK